ncbi:hypothetical protein EDC19_0380 [Natranaerovirga hydrolytica]|uniref:Leucine rich repeat (LRR) protein n=2 Tax=Natranaerovirga hydrolytica TaxID=680378 RepID=A0A4R1N1V1_9FIRM|nr:hypothetical protein EDC19_0380 [Natranaerovirga hydrolytica]
MKHVKLIIISLVSMFLLINISISIRNHYINKRIEEVNQVEFQFENDDFKNYLIELSKSEDLNFFNEYIQRNFEEPITTGDVKNIEYLTLGISSGEGNIEEESIQELIKLAKKIKTIEQIQAFENLSNLKIFDVPIKSIEPLKSLDKLSYLEINGTHIKDISPIQNSEIYYIVLNNTKIQDLSILNNMEKLKFITLMENNDIKEVVLSKNNVENIFIQNTPPQNYSLDLQLYDMPELKSLTVFNNLNNLKLRKLPELNKLEISGRKGGYLYIQEEDFEGIDSLEQITIKGENKIKTIDFLLELPNINHIRIWKSEIETLFIHQENESIKVLDLSSGILTNVTGIHNLINLTALDLSNNKLEDISMFFDEHDYLLLPNLEYLNLKNNKIPEEQINKYEPILRNQVGRLML